nr:hypothetical protein [Tanacetum cinerariifolium]
MVNLLQYNLALEERLDKHGSRLYNLENHNIPYQVSKAVDEIVTDAVDWAMQALLRAHFNDLSAVDMKEILHQQMFTDKSYEAHEDHKNLFDALQKSLERDYSNQLLSDLEEACHKKRKRRELPTTPFGPPPSQPPPPPPPAGTSGAQDFEGLAYEVVKAFYLDVIHLQFQMEECYNLLTDQIEWANPGGDQVKINVNRPLPLGGPPSHVIIQTQFFFNKDLEYFRYSNKGSSPTLSISKMKTACYPYFGLKLLVSKQLWIDDVCTYDISAKYVVFPAKNNARKIMRFNKIYKFSDGTLTRIMEALDYKVKEFKIKQLNLVQASDLNVNKMASADNTSGPALQRKERFPTVVAAPRDVDPAGLPSSTTIDQDIPSGSSSPTTQEIQSQVTHQGVEEKIHRHQNAQFDNVPLIHNLSSDQSSEETTL